MLNWCFDQFVQLEVKSSGQPTSHILLSWGEGPSAGSRVLWRLKDE